MKVITLLTLLLFGSTALLKADFFAYQLWVHPETGQHIHLFSDMHQTITSKNTVKKQQEDFVHMVHTKNGLSIIEDRVDFINKNESRSSYLALTFKQYVSSRFGTINVTSNNPLTGLIQYCEKRGIPCINCDDRQFEEDIYGPGCQRVDQNIFSQINQNKTSKHIFIAAGHWHIINTGKWLAKQEFKQQRMIMHTMLKDYCKTNINLFKWLENIDIHINDDALIALSYYPLNIEEIFQPKVANNQMTEFSFEEITAYYQSRQTLIRIASATSIIAFGFAFLSWWYGQ